MRAHPITKTELAAAQVALFIAIALQFLVWQISPSLVFGPQYLIVAIELTLTLLLGFTATTYYKTNARVHHNTAIILLAIISAANISSLILVLDSLILGTVHVSGFELLVASVAIFLTNIIVFSLWYWEIDSPGLTGKKWSRHDKDFQFPQQDLGHDFANWQPRFFDYLYLSLTNAINFAAADAKPITTQAKGLMGIQALVSVFTLALVVARSVSILG